jgi:hypothetical protein
MGKEAEIQRRFDFRGSGHGVVSLSVMVLYDYTTWGTVRQRKEKKSGKF